MRKPMIHVEVARKLGGESRSKVEAMVKAALVDMKTEEDVKQFNFSDFIARNPSLKNHIQSIRVYLEKDGPSGKKKATTTVNSLTGPGFSAASITAIRSAMDMDLPINERNGNRTDAHRQQHSTGTGPGYAFNLLAFTAMYGLDMAIHVYDLNNEGEEAEFMEDEENNDQSAASSHHWILPSASFEGLWDTLLFETDIQSRLLKYINSALLFSEKGVDTNLISWNKVILLHGPAGTGKTSLCKALAQKATVRLGHRYRYGQLIEINSHSLFSKWFSESGKLVMKMFEKIHDLVEDPQCLVFLLIDEVESLAQCRTSAEAGNEPTDSIRAVNALLTQIDRIKKFPNVVILTTSNMVGCIDLAFVDRADLKILIGPPPTDIIYRILASSINELIRVGIVQSDCPLPNNSTTCGEDSVEPDVSRLLAISRLASGISGRTLRKIPFLAYSNFMTSTTADLPAFLRALKLTVETEMKEVEALRRKPLPA